MATTYADAPVELGIENAAVLSKYIEAGQVAESKY
jgi:hypothetical protein